VRGLASDRFEDSQSRAESIHGSPRSAAAPWLTRSPRSSGIDSAVWLGMLAGLFSCILLRCLMITYYINPATGRYYKLSKNKELARQVVCGRPSEGNQQGNTSSKRGLFPITRTREIVLGEARSALVFSSTSKF